MDPKISRPNRILVAGAGALGASTAVRLAQAGHEVSVGVRTAESARFINAEGLTLEQPDGSVHRAMIPAYTNPAELGAPVDMIVVATKASAAVSVATQWIGALREDGALVPYQNGMLSEAMAKIAGPRLVDCAVYYGATLLAPGKTRMTGTGHLHIGPWPTGDTGPGTKTAWVASVLGAVAPTHTYSDMLSVKWNKLVANSVMTSLGVMTGLVMGDMMRHSVVRRAFLDVAAESMCIAQAAGAKPVSLGGRNVARLIGLPRWLGELVLYWSVRGEGRYKSSSQQSLERGEPTEVDYLNGRIVQEASLRGIPACWNEEIVSMVHGIETDPTSAGKERVEELTRRVRQRTASQERRA